MRAKTARSHIGMVTSFPLHEVIGNLVEQLSYDQLVELIVEIDAQCQDWEVTEKLHKHFAGEMKKLAKEETDAS